MKNLLFLSLLAVLFGGIWACSQSGKADATLAAKGGPSVHPFMDPDKAISAINAWRAKRRQIDTVIRSNAPIDTTYIARGFHVPFNDIKGILSATRDTNSVFAMMAIQYDSTTNPPSPRLTLIFQAKDANGVNRYYDFTQPCPTTCPQ